MAEHERICGPWFLRMAIASAGSWLAITSPCPVLAQLSSDNTLGTTVGPDAVIRGILSNQIDGGAIRGANLFHSFREFNIGDGRGVYFSNPSGIQNIISRVTGGSRSDILGTLGVLGNANLFLLNPNGLFFGPNARLDVSGSFIGSTASGVTFADGTQFSTAGSSPTLTVSTPLGLQFGQTAGEIRSQSAQLSVPPNQTLALVGGDLSLEGGLLSANGGRVELGSVAGGSRVDITPVSNGLTFDYGGVKNFRNIQLSKQVRVQANEPLGVVNIQAGQFMAREEADISVTTFGAGNAGSLTIRAAESVELAGASTNLFGQVAPTASGRGGDITIETKRFISRDGAQVSSTSRGTGDAGALTIRASDSIELTGDGTAFFANVQEGAIGNGGDINLETKSLTLREGAFISATTSGAGNAGNINVRASDLVDLVGKKPQVEDQTSRNTTTVTGTTITTTITTITSTGVVTTTTTTTTTTPAPTSAPLASTTTGLFARAESGSQGNAGNVKIETGKLRVQDDSRISTSTAGQGRGGNQTIIARDSVELGYGDLFSQVLQGSQGDGGNITIQTGTLELRRGSIVSVNNFGAGRGGNLEISATNIFLGNQTKKTEDSFKIGKTSYLFPLTGALTATSASGTGGNISLNVENLLLLRLGSLISATAGTAGAGGDGGNVVINASFIAAVPRENSDIRANAFEGTGGSVRISAREIFGIREQPFDTSRSDITASSTRGVAGTITIATPDFAPIRAVEEVPTPNTEYRLIAQGCQSEKGRGGRLSIRNQDNLPRNPVEIIAEGTRSDASMIVEAQGWIRHPNDPSIVFFKAQPIVTSRARSISPCDTDAP